MSETLKRVQMLIRSEQYRALAKVAEIHQLSIAEATRQVIDRGLAELSREDEFSRRAEALRQAKRLRSQMRQRRGQPLNVDIIADIEMIREVRDGQVAGGSD